MKPVALVTPRVTHYREEPFRLLDEAEGVEVLAWDEDRGPSQREVIRRIGQGRYRAVICGLGGRLVLPGSYLAARRAKVPWILWASIWSHPRTVAHALSYPPTAALYRVADAVVTYGPHVSRYVERRRTKGNVFEAPQAVDPAFAEHVSAEEREGFTALFVGRLEREKGVEVLQEAWRATKAPGARLVWAGTGPLTPEAGTVLGPVAQNELPALYAAADVLVLPSIRTATFTEPWGLVCNEAMMQGTPVIASDAVGAAAGGLVRHERNGLVVPAGEPAALSHAISLLASNPALRTRLGENAREDVQPYNYGSWVEGMKRSLEAVGAGRGDARC
ncbi:MAG: glycosyltransferase family 4 protein [Thermoleophilaceae bacterium]|nr:glycosyltransferase family 4 protein [Thermoleophilaceae bacterium]